MPDSRRKHPLFGGTAQWRIRGTTRLDQQRKSRQERQRRPTPIATCDSSSQGDGQAGSGRNASSGTSTSGDRSASSSSRQDNAGNTGDTGNTGITGNTGNRLDRRDERLLVRQLERQPGRLAEWLAVGLPLRLERQRLVESAALGGSSGRSAAPAEAARADRLVADAKGAPTRGRPSHLPRTCARARARLTFRRDHAPRRPARPAVDPRALVHRRARAPLALARRGSGRLAGGRAARVGRVPARNEARNIARCVASALATNVLAARGDRRGRSLHRRTGAIAARASRSADARLRVVVPPPLPDGWFGKQWACAAGAARGAR